MENTFNLSEQETILIKALLAQFVEFNIERETILYLEKKNFKEVAKSAYYKISGTELVNKFKSN